MHEKIKSNQIKGKLRLKSGFTLVELAIVIVITGLLVGGVLAGQELIKQAEIIKAASDINDMVLSKNVFQTKYGQLPGDFDKATSFFPDCVIDTPNLMLCNGDGDGTFWSIGQKEDNYYWHHLSLSGLIKGLYLPQDDFDTDFEKYFPKLMNVYPVIATSWFGLQEDFGFFSDGNYFMFMQPSSISVKSQKIYFLDKKIDDGDANKGLMRVNRADGSDCVDGDYKYIVDDNSEGLCNFIYSGFR